MGPPRRRRKQFDFLRDQQGPEFRREALDEILVGVKRSPVRPTIRIVLKLPQVHQLIDGAGIRLKVTDQLAVQARPLQRRETQFGLKLHRLAHLAHL